MTRSAELKMVNCSSCGAGLNVLGGGRVTTHVCSYCGSALDANANYRALKSFGELPRPSSPFKLGDRGRVFGAEFTVIGTLGYEERWQGQRWHWVEHQVFSETHGYAWLSVEDGHVTFSRRIRSDVWLSELRVETSEYQPSVSYRNESYKYYATTNAVITFAEGEFTWQPEKGQRTQTITALGDTRMLEFSQGSTEREAYLTSYVPAEEIAEGFGIDLPPPMQKVHPLKPVKTWRHSGFVAACSAIFAAMSLILGLILSLNPGETLVSSTYDVPNDLPITLPLEITDGRGLARIGLDSSVTDGWAYLSVVLLGPDGNPRFVMGRTSEKYSGRDSEGKWTEDGSDASIRFHPLETTGTYELTIDIEEAGYWKDRRELLLDRDDYPQVIRQLDLSVSQGQSSGLVAYLAALAFLVMAVIPLFARGFAHQKRWSGSDWDDDE